MSDLLTQPVTVDPALDGGHDLFSHLARKDDITNAYILGTAITALCGKTWVPSRDPNNYPLCPECKEIHEGLPD